MGQRRSKYFGIVQWCKQDLVEILKENGISPNWKNIRKLRDACDNENLEEYMIATGWDYIQSCVEYLWKG